MTNKVQTTDRTLWTSKSCKKNKQWKNIQTYFHNQLIQTHLFTVWIKLLIIKFINQVVWAQVA